MKNIWKYLKTQKLFWLTIILPTAICAFTFAQLASNPWNPPGGTAGATLDAILATPPANITILVSDHQTLDASSDRTLPATCSLKVVQPGYITVPTGRTLTVSGSVDAGSYQIFACTSTGKVQFAGPQPYLHARWWGATGDGSTDDTTALQAAFTAVCGAVSPYYPSQLIASPYDNYKVETLTLNSGNSSGVIIDFKGARLLQKTTNDVLDITGTGTRLSLSNMRVSGAGSPGSYAGSGINVIGTNAYLRDILIEKMDKCLNLGYVLYSNFDNMIFQQCNNAVNMVGGTSGQLAHVNRFSSIRINNTYADAIAINTRGGIGHEFDRITFDSIHNRIMNIDSCQNIIFKSLYYEGAGDDNTATEQFLINNASMITFENGSFNVSTVGSEITRAFRITGSSFRIAIRDTYWYNAATATVPLYSTDGSVTGLSFVRNHFPIGNITSDANPQANYDDCSTTTASCVGFSLPATAVKRSGGGLSNVAGINYDMSQTLTLGYSADSTTSAYDTGTFVVGTRSWKITWGTGVAAAWARIQSFFTVPAAGTYYPVISGYIKADSNQTVALGNINGTGDIIPIPNDGQWHFYSSILPAIVNPGGNGAYFQVVNGTGAQNKNVWVDKVALYYFATPQEAMNMIGRD